MLRTINQVADQGRNPLPSGGGRGSRLTPLLAPGWRRGPDPPEPCSTQGRWRGRGGRRGRSSPADEIWLVDCMVLLLHDAGRARTSSGGGGRRGAATGGDWCVTQREKYDRNPKIIPSPPVRPSLPQQAPPHSLLGFESSSARSEAAFSFGQSSAPPGAAAASCGPHACMYSRCSHRASVSMSQPFGS